MEVARIKDGIVVNLEVADEAWVAANDGVDGYTFVPFDLYATDNAAPPPQIGLRFDPATGRFEQPTTGGIA